MARCSKDAFSACAVLINPSRFPRKARSLARRLAFAGASRVVVCATKEELRAGARAFVESEERFLLVFGGDGTVHEALNALFSSSGGAGALRGKALGFLRGGSGNGYHDSYRVPVLLRKQLAEYALSMSLNVTVNVDLVRVDFEGGPLYGQLAGVGFDAEVLAKREVRTRRPGAVVGEPPRFGRAGPRPTRPRPKGLVGYAAAAFEAFRGLDLSSSAPPDTLGMILHPGTASRSGDGRPLPGARPEDSPGPLSLAVSPAMVEVGKRPCYGNRFRVCPEAVCDDGLLEVVLFNFDRKISALVHLPSLWAGRHRRLQRLRGKGGRPLIERRKAVRMEVSSEGPIAFHVDGELPRASGAVRSLSLTVFPGAIHFVVPRRFARGRSNRPPVGRREEAPRG